MEGRRGIFTNFILLEKPDLKCPDRFQHSFDIFFRKFPESGAI
jgi:hypothetical protein